MTDFELESAVLSTGLDQLRRLTSDANPDAASREGYRRVVREIAAGEWPPRPPAATSPATVAYPSLAAQLGTAAAAAARFVASGGARVEPAEYERRRRVCAGCPNYDDEAERCRKCGCFLAVKPWLKSESCPEGRWEAL